MASDDETALDPQTREMLARLAADPFLDPATMTPAQMRVAFDAFYAKLDLPPADVDVSEGTYEGPAGKRALRIYHPKDASGPLPIVVYIKGGGLIMGTLDSYDRICRRLCKASGTIIVSVDYRQPPEHRHPAAIEDCYAAVAWARANAARLGSDPDRLAVAGESGGGMLAAIVTHLAHDRGGPPIRYQLLIYPAVGTRGDSRSMRDYARGYWFEPEQLDWLYSQYVSDPSEITDPLVSPVWRADLSGLPPAYVVVANFDILRDDIEDYAARLAAAGVPVEVERYPTTIHGFMNMGGVIDLAGTALDACGGKLAAALAENAVRA